MQWMRSCIAGALLGGILASGQIAWAESAPTPYIVVASTTSTEQSGLLGWLKEKILADLHLEIRVVAVGTGQAIDIGKRGDADVLLVHDMAAESQFAAEGYGVKRWPVMHNDFVILGPKEDPAGIKGGHDAVTAMRHIRQRQATFVSRGDRSGTHMAELRLWQEAGSEMPAAGGAWYRQIGAGMGPALNTAAQLDAYLLADRGTWLSFKNRGNLAVLVEGDPRLFNPYGVILVNPAKHPQVKAREGQKFIDWLISPPGQQAIANYKINGQQLFYPDAGK